MKQTVGAVRHVVVVDADLRTRASLVDYLQSNGFSASGAGTTQSLARASDQRRADLVIVDLLLPEENGLARCAAIREELRIPVIAMSAKASDIDRILALEVGADDFIAKPFNPREVLARVRNVLRRAETSAAIPIATVGERYSFAGWMLDTTSRTLVAPTGESVCLAGGEFELLFALVTNANRVLTRDELLELTKGRGAQPFDRSIDVKISRLRQRLGDHSHAGRIIKAIYGKGYVLAAPVAIES